MRIVGLDIGSYSIKVAELESNTARLLRYFEHTLNPDPTKDRHLEVVDFIRNNISGPGSQAGQFVIALRQEQVTHRRLSFPFRERFKIEKSLGFELEDELPFSYENAMFDFKVIGYDGKGSDIFAMATPKTAVTKIRQEARDAGFEPSILSVEGMAYNNLLENWSDLPPYRESSLDLPAEAGGQEADAFLHTGHSHCMLVIRSGHRLVDIKTFDGGGLDIAKLVSTTYSMPLSEAIKQVNSKGFVLINPQGATKDQVAFSDVFKKALAPLAQNIRLALLDAESSQKIEIKTLKISGGLAQVRNIQPFFTQQLNVAVNTFTPSPYMINIEGAQFDPNRGLIALGLAIEGLRKARNPAITFLRGDFRRENKSLKEFMETYGTVVRYAAAVYVMFFLYAFCKDMVAGYTANKAEQALTETGRQMKLKASRVRSEAAKRIRAYHESEKQKAFIDSLSKLVSAMDILKDISSKAPVETLQSEVSSLRINEDSVRIEGTIPDTNSVDRFKSNLAAMAKGTVEAAAGTAANPSVGGRKGFSINFKVARTGRSP